MNKKLEEEVGYIDDCDVFLTTDRIDDILLQQQKIVVRNNGSIECSKVYNHSSFFDAFYYTSSHKDG